MSISKPRNSFLKSKNFSDRKAQQTFCKKASRNTKNTCLDKLDTMKVSDNRILMNMTLNENISTDSVLCRGFSNFFSKAPKELQISSISNYVHNESTDPLEEALGYFKNYLSIVNIKKGFRCKFKF